MSHGLAPNFSIAVEGTILSENTLRRMRMVKYEDNAELADKITLTADDPDRALLDSKIFAEGNLIELQMGYENDLENMQAGIVTSVKPTFPEGGATTLTVEALDGSGPMMDTQKQLTKSDRKGRNYKSSDSSIAEQIFDGWGYLSLTDDTPIRKGASARIQRRDTTDWKFLLELAELYGFTVAVDWDFQFRNWLGTFIAPLDSEDPVFNLPYDAGNASTLLSFKPEWAITGQITEVTMAYYDVNAAKVKILSAKISLVKGKSPQDLKFQSKANSPLEDELKDGAIAKFSVAGETIDAILPSKSFQNEDEARAFAEQWIRARSDGFVHGTGNIVGHPRIRATQVNTLTGIGKRLTGDWYFTKATHTMARGAMYKVGFSARKVVPQ